MGPTIALGLLMSDKFIFIVGLSRSGTTLMRKIINSSDEIGICDENHFLGHLIPSQGARHAFRKIGNLSNDENVHRLVNYIYSGEYERDTKYRLISFQWRWMIKRVDREIFLQKLLASDRSERAIFIAMMEVFIEKRGRSIMGEKTPAHLRYVDTLIEWFPTAKVIHMLRDPRAIYVSEYRRRKELPITPPFKQLKRFDLLFKTFLVLQVSVIWLEGLFWSARFKKRYPNNYYLQCFEDIVNDPENSLQKLCDFLEIDFDPAMLEQVVVSRGFSVGEKGFDAKAATRWKKHIDPWIEKWFNLIFGKYLKKFGYISSQNSLQEKVI
jgi:hypothetical protein